MIGTKKRKAENFPADDFERVQVLDVVASAGPGTTVGEEGVVEHMAFRKDWLSRVTSAPLAKLRVIEADGDSMLPTIQAGDHMLIDMQQKNPRRDGIYVIDWDDLLNVKRVTADPTTQTISISSDNPAYLSKSGVSPEAVRVVGRVVWIGRRV